MKQRVTIKSIAEKAGVNWATVSRALNPETASLISEKVRKKIQAISDELGYRPSYSGRSIVTGKTYKIGMILGNMRLDFAAHDWARIICGFSAEIQKHGYVLSLLYANGSETMDTQVSNFLMSGVADGYVTGPSMIGGGVRAMLDKVKSPLWVVCESGVSIANVNHIQRDDTAAFCEIWRNIPKRCLKKMLFFGRKSTVVDIRRNEAERAGKIVYPGSGYSLDGMFYPGNGILADYRTSLRFCMMHLEELKRYKFIWCDSDASAMGVCDALESAGIKVGKDVFVVGYGDYETYDETVADRRLSTVSADAEEIGAALGRGIFGQIAGKTEREIVVGSHFISRETFPVK